MEFKFDCGPKNIAPGPMDVGWHQDRAIQLRQLGFVLACIRCGDLAVRVGPWRSGSLNFSDNSLII